MTSSTRVTLKTEGGKWEYTTTLSDPIFSDILAPYIELGETPEEVLLEGSVAEIIESGWTSWERIKALIDKHPFCLDGAFTCTLDESLIQLETLLNLPVNWILCASLDRSKTSHQERIKHYKRVGALLVEMDALLRCDGATRHVVSWMLVELDDEDSEQILIGMRWEAGVAKTLLREGKVECLLLAMDWESFATHLGSREWDEGVTNTVALLLGRGNLGGPDLFRDISHVGRSVGVERHLIDLYKVLMRNLRPDSALSPSCIGFGDLVQSPGEVVDGALQLICRVHSWIIDTGRMKADIGGAFWKIAGRRSTKRIASLLEANLQSLSYKGLRNANTFLSRVRYLAEQES